MTDFVFTVLLNGRLFGSAQEHASLKTWNTHSVARELLHVLHGADY